MNTYFLSTLTIILLLSGTSCGDCEFLAEQYRTDHFDIILEKVPYNGRMYALQGINPIDGQQEKYRSQGGFLGSNFRKLIAVGDTLVKKPGELKVYIHKKDTVIVFPFKCEGKVYE